VEEADEEVVPEAVVVVVAVDEVAEADQEVALEEAARLLAVESGLAMGTKSSTVSE
jgi:hypothetical protein